MSQTTYGVEDIVDAIHTILDPVPTDVAMSALIAAIMSTSGRCKDPQRALLGVYAAIADLIRFAERDPDDKVNVVELAQWVNDSWEEG